MSVLDNEENIKLCLCLDCPTYKSSNLTGILFCSKGKTKEKVKNISCNCPSCSVFSKYGLNQIYYCIKGKNTEKKP
jgi:hypothetical protein